MSRFPETWCSQCGQSFGPGDSGFSNCADHKPTPTMCDLRRLEHEERLQKHFERMRNIYRDIALLDQAAAGGDEFIAGITPGTVGDRQPGEYTTKKNPWGWL